MIPALSDYRKKKQSAGRGIIGVSPICIKDLYNFHQQQNPEAFNSTVPFHDELFVHPVNNQLPKPTSDSNASTNGVGVYNSTLFDNSMGFPSYHQLHSNPSKQNTSMNVYSSQMSREYSKLRGTI